MTLLLCISMLCANSQVDPSLLNSTYFTTTYTTVPCTLEDGTSTTCYEIRFIANPLVNGPYCPDTTSDIGGMAIYTEGSGTGLSALNSTLFATMEGDGFDIVDNMGNIRINDPSVGGGVTPGFSYCLQASEDNDLELVYLIPVTPSNLMMVNNIDAVEKFGVSLNGIPLTGAPPAAVGGGPGGGGPGGGSDALMPALDPCGGHHDPAGYYHWHMIANSTNNVLTSLGITDVSCTNFSQDDTAFAGYANDGYPIYGEKESNGSTPTGLDACNGHIGVTPEYPGGTYHYHSVSDTAPNVMPCLVGKSANNNFTYSYYDSSVLGIDDVEEEKRTLIENPVIDGSLNIEYINSPSEIKVYNYLGQLVISKPNKELFGQIMINVSNLSNGTYFVKSEFDTSSSVKKIIIKN